MTKRKDGPRRPYRRASERRRGRFLRALAASGNISEAAAATGFPRATIYKLRARDPAFARGIAAAIDAAGARLETAEAAGEPPQGSEPGLVIRRGRGGRAQLVSAGTRWWDARADAVFLAYFRCTANVRLSARAAGFSAKAAHERRARSPGFARGWDEAAGEAEIRLEWRLIAEVNGTARIPTDLDIDAFMDAAEEAAEKAFDPWLAMSVLKLLDGRREGRGNQRLRRPRTFEEVRASIHRKIDAIERYQRKFGGGG